MTYDFGRRIPDVRNGADYIMAADSEAQVTITYPASLYATNDSPTGARFAIKHMYKQTEEFAVVEDCDLEEVLKWLLLKIDPAMRQSVIEYTSTHDAYTNPDNIGED